MTLALIAAAVALVGQIGPGQDASPSRAVAVAAGKGSPAVVASVRLISAGSGLQLLECALENGSDEALWRVEGLLLIYDSTGARKSEQALSLGPDDTPIEAHAKRTAKVQLPYLDLEDDDILRFGLAGVATATTAWTNDRLREESDAEMEAAFAPPMLVVLDPEDAPIRLANVDVRRDAENVPVSLSMVLKNVTDRAVVGIAVAACVFSDKGRLASYVSRSWSPRTGLHPGAAVPVELSLRPNEAGLRVVVAVHSTKDPEWRAADLVGQAKAAVVRKRRSSGN